MSGRAGFGAAVGLWIGLGIIGWLILLPRVQDGDFYEVGDPLVYLGLPILVVCSGVAAVVGIALGARKRDRLSPSGRATATALGVTGVLSTAALMLWGTQ